MKKILFLLPLLVLTGCGHNVATNSKGWGIDVSWQNDSYMPSVRLGMWETQCAVVKENAQAQITSDGEIGVDVNDKQVAETETEKTAETDKVNGAKGVVGSKVKLKTGQQINGYTKDVLTSPDIKETNVNMADKIFNKQTSK